MNRHQKKQKIFYTSLLIGSVLIFVVSAYFAHKKVLMPWEKSLLLAIYHLPVGMRPFWLVITQFGSAWMLLVVAIILLIGRARSQHWGRWVLVNGSITYILLTILKHAVGRPRPFVLLSGLSSRELLVSGLGFPSGHVAMATVVSLTLVRYMPAKWRWLPVVWIGLVGFSRLYLGVHAPLDIIGGFTLGLAVVSTERLLRVK